MLKNLKYQFRSLAKHRTISLISIGGFALSGAIVLLLLAFISAERSFDKDIPNVNNIYRVLANGNISDIPEDAAEIIKEQIPGIQEISNYYVEYKPVTWQNKSYPSKMICTDNEIFNILGTEVIAGCLDNFHANPEEVVLTESFAKKIFKEKNPIGQIINLSHKQDAVVMAIIKDFPKNRSFDGQVFCSNKLKVTYSQRGWNGKSTYFDKMLVKLSDKASVKNIEKQLKPIINNLFYFYAEGDYNYTLSPLKNAYFIPVKYDGLNHANVKLIDLLSWLALIILVFAIFNYVNFSVAKISTEFKNVGMHQILGASRFKLFGRFISSECPIIPGRHFQYHETC